MSHISIILAHPNENSFNHAIAQEAVLKCKTNGYRVRLHDLYQEKFDPILSSEEIPTEAELPPEIERHCLEIQMAQGIIVVHPNWWGQPPAILKGWIDRVIRPQVAYKFLEGDKGEGIPVGLLKAKAALVFNTANTPMERERSVFRDPLQRLWINCIFELCGVKRCHRKMFTVVVTSSVKQRKQWLDQVATIVNQHFPKTK